jgi:hypothetical protein
VGFVSSTDGGSTWHAQRLAGPFRNDWLPLREAGYGPGGDYISVSFVNGQAVAVFTAAAQGSCELGKTSCHTWIASATIPVAGPRKSTEPVVTSGVSSTPED